LAHRRSAGADDGSQGPKALIQWKHPHFCDSLSPNADEDEKRHGSAADDMHDTADAMSDTTDRVDDVSDSMELDGRSGRFQTLLHRSR
jgi:hypothetical protein